MLRAIFSLCSDKIKDTLNSLGPAKGKGEEEEEEIKSCQREVGGEKG